MSISFKKSVIIVDAPGQMCNRIWSAAAWISYCNLHNYYIIWMGFYEYVSKFKIKNKNENLYILYGFWPNILNMYFSKLCVLICRKLQSLDHGFGFLNLIFTEKSFEYFSNSNKGILIIEGWPSRKPTNSLRHGYKYLSQIFQVNQPPSISWSPSSKVKIGVHIRKGDYINFQGGIFYYEDSTYIENILYLISELSIDSESINIFLSSNSIISKNNIRDKLSFYVLSSTNDSSIDDLFGLSQCDYILGPPSSFSCWAAFIGNSKLAFITNPHSRVLLKDYQKISYDDVRDECRSRVGYWWP